MNYETAALRCIERAGGSSELVLVAFQEELEKCAGKLNVVWGGLKGVFGGRMRAVQKAIPLATEAGAKPLGVFGRAMERYRAGGIRARTEDIAKAQKYFGTPVSPVFSRARALRETRRLRQPTSPAFVSGKAPTAGPVPGATAGATGAVAGPAATPPGGTTFAGGATMQPPSVAEAAGEKAPGFLTQHLGLYPTPEKGMLGGQTAGAWWRGLAGPGGAIGAQQRNVLLGAGGTLALGAGAGGLVLGRMGNKKTVVEYR